MVNFFNSPDGPHTSGGYSQAVSLPATGRLILVSGQIPEAKDGTVPADFASQCRLVWRNVQAQLRSAGADLTDIVKVSTYLSDRQYRTENSAIRQEVLGNAAPALTVLIAGIYDDAWLLEIEVMAWVK